LKNFIDDLQSLKSFGQTLTPEVLEILKRVITDTDLLIVDDVDFIHNRVENLYEICSKLETRMQSCKATIFIANYSLAELKKRFVTKLPKYREFYERFFDRMIIKTKNRVFFVDKLNR
jgi:DNA replication protein DnaC